MRFDLASVIRLAKSLLIVGVMGAVWLVVIIVYARWAVLSAADGRIAHDVAALEPTRVGLVLGTSPELWDARFFW